MDAKDREKFHTAFTSFDRACKDLKLSNSDQALMLQVTPVMISRYRSEAAAMPLNRAKERFKIGADVLKLLRPKKKQLLAVEAYKRMGMVVATLRELGIEDAPVLGVGALA